MTLLSDNSVVLTSIETGSYLMWFDLDFTSLADDDTIVDFEPTYSSIEPYFAILTRKGRLLIYHFTLVD